MNKNTTIAIPNKMVDTLIAELALRGVVGDSERNHAVATETMRGMIEGLVDAGLSRAVAVELGKLAWESFNAAAKMHASA